MVPMDHPGAPGHVFLVNNGETTPSRDHRKILESTVAQARIAAAAGAAKALKEVH